MMTFCCVILVISGLFKLIGKKRIVGIIFLAFGVVGFLMLCTQFGGVEGVLNKDAEILSNLGTKAGKYASEWLDKLIEYVSGLWAKIWATAKHILGIETATNNGGGW